VSSPFTEEMQRTAVQRKVIVKAPPSEALQYATTFLEERGYRAGPGARPNRIFALGGREGALPRVTAEIAAQGNVGKAKTTLVTISGFGERLGPVLLELVAALRASRTAPEPTPDL
jgi:hypothetical protein